VSKQRLRFELAAVREENERLEERLTHAERDASRYRKRRTTPWSCWGVEVGSGCTGVLRSTMFGLASCLVHI
jgi:hypothetical protein